MPTCNSHGASRAITDPQNQKENRMNVRLLRRIQKQILKEPRQFYQDAWFERAEGIPNCGTAACIAGWAIALSKKMTPAKAIGKFKDPSKFGRRLLDLEKEQSEKLFYRENWPSKYGRLYSSSSIKEKARTAVKRIDRFISTNGAE